MPKYKTYTINLSDICASNVDVFRTGFQYMMHHSDDLHSIFSPKRAEELNRILVPEPKIFAGWGAHPFLKRKVSSG